MSGKEAPVTLRGPKVKGPEGEHAITYYENSPAKKVKVQCAKSTTADVTGGFETAWAEAVKDINLVFSMYSKVLRERAAADASQIEELEDILTEALSLESQLLEKKEHLRQSLAVISDKLQK
ncbi:testis-expressed protein 12 [Brachyhypopomus gauderio]|uniref:testis-expressed protein 12 n=1 Tax=Brachyhypopomus gauderio TaxID=698409 RepID=UPI0040429C40